MLQADSADFKRGMILAIPSGGVPVGLMVKDALGLPMDLMIARKLQIPGTTEAGFGAMAQDGSVFFNESLLNTLHLSGEEMAAMSETHPPLRWRRLTAIGTILKKARYWL